MLTEARFRRSFPVACTYVLLFLVLQILKNMIENSSTLFHNKYTAKPIYTSLQAFQKLASRGKVMDLSMYTHEARWVKSPAELKLMRDSASIGCQVLVRLQSCIEI